MIQIDMKMPESCKECQFFDKEDLCYIDETYAISDEQIKTKPKWCPLIDVPEANTMDEAISFELEKIKGEIIKLPKQGYFVSSDGTMGGYRERSAEDYEVDVLNIIDNHIKELKGENNE